MAPVSREHDVKTEEFDRPDDAPISDDSVVISGMSSLMPNCQNVSEFAEKLYNKENLVTCDKPRWKISHPELVQHYGKISEMSRFDAQFFMIHYKLCESTEVMSRKLLEQAHQAIFDAGVCPTELSGKRVGVFIASGLSEIEMKCSVPEYYCAILGCSRTMYANRISYWLNAKGPSYTVDAACCGALVALENAHQAILRGQCEAAIVGAAKITLNPHASINYQRLIPLNPDGKTKCYDVNADGQSMSDAISVIYLQKYKDARRVYAELRHVKTAFAEGLHKDFSQKFGPQREPAMLAKFLRTFYDEADVSPSSVEYIEGFGSALPDTDKAELQSIEEVFCKDRSKPLLIGSVTSNMGFTGAASGTCGIIKLLLAYQKGELAANLHCENPRQDIAALRDGRMRIVTEHQRFQRSYSALNCFSITGINGHVLLQGHYKKKDISKYHSHIPYLVTVSGREEAGVEKILNSLRTSDLDPEAITLLHNIHRSRISKHLARGFGVYSTENNETVTLRENVNYYDDLKRPLWFVYSGMGSQWAGMGAQLMRIPIFAAAIERCGKVLEPKGVDIIKIITSHDKTILDNILNSFLGIAAIQIGLTDVLRAVGLVPDKMIGHSVGELGCAYADGCCTAEEMILLSYYRGLVSVQTSFIRGSMAAVGIGYKQISKMCPPEIEVACHNGPNSSTICGPIHPMSAFIAQLVSQGIFAKEVKCSNIAYHSKYIAEAGPELLNYYNAVIETPKLRSERWVSTSVQQEKWNEPEAMYSSAEYHTNNMLNPVLFEETSRLVPPGAVLVEVAPHGLLQAILKRSLPPDCRNIPLTSRGHDDNVIFLLEAIGKLYMQGYDLDMAALYPKIELPVSTQTRQLSHLVEWVHTEKWKLCLCIKADIIYASIYKPIVTVHDEENEFLKGSIIQGRTIFPYAGALVYVWDTLAMTLGKPTREMSVQFQDVQFHTQPELHEHIPLYLSVSLQRGTGKFEVTNEHCIVAEGYIMAISAPLEVPIVDIDEPMELNHQDVYKLFYERGYEYRGEFRSILDASISLAKGKLIWSNNWVTYIDGILQLNALRQKHDAVSQPHHINHISINIMKHINNIETNGKTQYIHTTFCKLRNATRSGGVVIENIMFKDKPSKLPKYAGLKTLKFFPFFDEENTDVSTTLCVFMQIISENINKNKITLLYCDKTHKRVLNEINEFLYSSTKTEVSLIYIGDGDIEKAIKDVNKLDVLFINSKVFTKKMFENLRHILPNDAFMITQGIDTHNLCPTSYKPVSVAGKGKTRLELARAASLHLPSTTACTVRTDADLDFLRSTWTSLPSQQNLLVIATNPPIAGLKELVKKWREETYHSRIYMVMLKLDFKEYDMERFPSFNLAFNILNYDKTWGGEYYIPLKDCFSTHRTLELRCAQFGDLNSLHWIEVPERDAPGIAVTVHYAGLNVYDAKRAVAEIPAKNVLDSGFGMDFSGVTQSGERVMGLVPEGAVCSQVLLQKGLLWPVPAHWSLEDAATVPLPYCLAFYCFGIKHKLTSDMTVLVHGGAGALGQAAISIALAIGCRVFATVSTNEKKNFLIHLFPQLPAKHITNSRDNTFRDIVMSMTNGEGCDIIISCVKGQLKDATLSCCAFSGTTFDTVQIPDHDNYKYGMFFMTKARSYIAVDFSSIFLKHNMKDTAQLQRMMSEGIVRGYVRPLSRVTYAPGETSRAFRLLAASRHRGRVLLRLRDSFPPAQPRMVCSETSSYLLLSDKEDFVFKFADKLVSRGAKKLYFHLTKYSATLCFKKQLWENQGVDVKLSSEKLNDSNAVIKLIKDCNRLGPVDGIFIISLDTPSNAYKTKLLFNISSLDILSRKMCPTLRYFAITSEDLNNGREVSESRARYGLASLSLQLKLNQFEAERESKTIPDAIKWRDAADIMERVLLSKDILVATYFKPTIQQDLLDEVARMPGIRISSNTVDRTRLEQVGVDEGRAQELCNILEEKFNIIISKENVPQMTIDQIKNMQVKVKDIKEDIHGIGAYFNHIDPDVLVYSDELVLMPTLVHKNIMRSEEFEIHEAMLCIVPGLEGHHERFRKMCERLKIPAVVLQLGLDKLNETVHEMAQRLVNVIMKKLKLKKHFYLLGYEFGVMVALEMAAILESCGLTGTVYCLGGTVEDIRAVLELKLGGMSEDILQNEVVRHIYSLLSGNIQKEIECDLGQVQSFPDKVKICLDRLRGRVPYPMQYIEALMESLYDRIKMTREYTGEVLFLQTKVILLRAILPITQSSDIHSTVIYNLEASLPYAPEDLRCPAIINKYLQPSVLKAFNKINHCENLLSDDMSIKLTYDE